MHSFTDPMSNFFNYRDVYFCKSGKWQRAEFDECKAHGKGIVGHLKGVDDRDVAATYCGLELSVAEAQLPALTGGEFYWHQLVGLKVATVYAVSEPVLLGEVKQLLETGSNDVLVVGKCPESLDDKERLIPYVPEQFIKDINLESGLILVDWDPEF
ncbi:Ribosome maturation factor RimM [Zhongshania aliphaticivorans]|uniref:Ribosome maturation factor RimM n=1 Tax=Zhongshania aliphaticivorans TaxID=1470434 RepID=A0A5S9P316_9GAMM|nr:Ribosome maturation factor RimM [Zhongshania aliphaticivorans]CAA0097528.1 Ribosome maturation factor RimM [Zhongshania aliphaticivorans]